VVPPDSHEISRVPCYLGTRPGATTLRLQGYHLLCRDFPDPSTSAAVYNSSPDQQLRQDDPTTPHRQHLPAITPTRFSLFRFRSPLLTESQLFSLPAGTEMFHFPAFPPNALCVQAPVTGHDSSRVSPFGHPRITARLPTPRGLSQAPTSFIGFWCQGIHRVPLLTCHNKQTHNARQNKDARVHYAVLKKRTDTTPHPPQHHHPAHPNAKPSTGIPPADPHGGRPVKERPDNPRKPKPHQQPPTTGGSLVCLIPQDPTTCLSPTHDPRPVPHPTGEPADPLAKPARKGSTRPRENHG
jgi:hypothetical protein